MRALRRFGEASWLFYDNWVANQPILFISDSFLRYVKIRQTSRCNFFSISWQNVRLPSPGASGVSSGNPGSTTGKRGNFGSRVWKVFVVGGNSDSEFRELSDHRTYTCHCENTWDSHCTLHLYLCCYRALYRQHVSGRLLDCRSSLFIENSVN